LKTHILGVLAVAAALVMPVQPAFSDMAMPSIAIVSPVAGATVTGSDIPVTIATKNFQTEMKDMGMPGKPGRGHIHVMVDGMDMPHLTNIEVMKHFDISGVGLAPGKHQITIVLATDDHTMASKPAMVTINLK
jgi:hypothetical protein